MSKNKKRKQFKVVHFLYHYKMKGAHDLEVYLDGVRQDFCVVANKKHDFVITALKGEEGKMVTLSEDRKVYTAFVLKEGKVEIRKKSSWCDEQLDINKSKEEE